MLVRFRELRPPLPHEQTSFAATTLLTVNRAARIKLLGFLAETLSPLQQLLHGLSVVSGVACIGAVAATLRLRSAGDEGKSYLDQRVSLVNPIDCIGPKKRCLLHAVRI